MISLYIKRQNFKALSYMQKSDSNLKKENRICFSNLIGKKNWLHITKKFEKKICLIVWNKSVKSIKRIVFWFKVEMCYN